MKYPVRCRIVDGTAEEVLPGVVSITPDVSRLHIGKEGLAEEVEKDGDVEILITLDDGNFLLGSECWWMPIVTVSKEEYDTLLDDSIFLQALLSAGVDNWEGYEFALEEVE